MATDKKAELYVYGLDGKTRSYGAWLVASSQGDHAFAVFAFPAMTPVGRFSMAEGATGAVQETDGIALAGGDYVPGFLDSLFIAQDGWNQPQAQNFKLVSWAAIKAALGLAP